MSESVDNIAGSTTSVGTDDSVVNGSISGYAPIIGNLVNGSQYDYKRLSEDGAEYETGRGLWVSATNTLTRVTIKTSSAGAPTKTTFSAGTGTIYIVDDAASLADMEKMVEGPTKKVLTVAERSKVGDLTVTAPVNLDTTPQTTSNDGAGEGLAKAKSGTDLPFKSLIAGTNVTLTSAADTLTIASTATAGDMTAAVYDPTTAASDAFSMGNMAETGTAKVLTGTERTAITANTAKLTADTTNVTAAGAVMDSELADLTGVKTLTLPDNTDITAYAKTVVGASTEKAARNLLRAKGIFPHLVGDCWFIVDTGQSNPAGVEPALVQWDGGVVNTNVWQYATAGTGAAPQSTNPAVGYTWQNPDPTDLAVTDINVLLPYVGYRRGGSGHQGMSFAHRLQVATGMDVYILHIGHGGASIQYWEAAGLDRILLDAFVPYVLANVDANGRGAALAGKTAPEIFRWGQSESNAIPLGAFPYDKYLAPLAYKDRWLAVYEHAHTTGLWLNKDYTQTYLTEPTQYCNWTCPDGTNAAVWPNQNAWRWEGINVVERHTNERVKLVSSQGVPYDGLAAGPYSNQVHFTGNGNNQLGEKNADMFLGVLETASRPSTQLQREQYPILGGNLDADQKNITNVGTTTTDNLTVKGEATNVATPDDLITMSTAANYNFPTTTLPSAFNHSPVNTLEQSADYVNLMGAAFKHSPTIKNASGTAVIFGPYSGLYSAPVFQADNAIVTQALEIDVVSNPTFEGINAGQYNLSVSFTNMSAGGVVGQGATITQRYAISGINMTIVGTGQVTRQAGFAALVSNATDNTGLLLGTPVSPVPTGDWGVYQDNEYISRWNGGVQTRTHTYSNVGVDLTSGLNAETHHRIIINGANNVVADFPLAASYPGQEYTLINAKSSGTLTFGFAGSDTAGGMAAGTLAAGNTVTFHSDGVSVWFRIAGDKS